MLFQVFEEVAGDKEHSKQDASFMVFDKSGTYVGAHSKWRFLYLGFPGCCRSGQ